MQVLDDCPSGWRMVDYSGVSFVGYEDVIVMIVLEFVHLHATNGMTELWECVW